MPDTDDMPDETEMDPDDDEEVLDPTGEEDFPLDEQEGMEPFGI